MLCALHCKLQGRLRRVPTSTLRAVPNSGINAQRALLRHAAQVARVHPICLLYPHAVVASSDPVELAEDGSTPNLHRPGAPDTPQNYALTCTLALAAPPEQCERSRVLPVLALTRESSGGPPHGYSPLTPPQGTHYSNGLHTYREEDGYWSRICSCAPRYTGDAYLSAIQDAPWLAVRLPRRCRQAAQRHGVARGAGLVVGRLEEAARIRITAGHVRCVVEKVPASLTLHATPRVSFVTGGRGGCASALRHARRDAASVCRCTLTAWPAVVSTSTALHDLW